MPNRMIRDWTNSDKIDRVSSHAERFFVRLIMKADDFGNYLANVKFINGNLFPLKEDIRDIDVAKWIDECTNAGLIAPYTVEGKKYLHINDFGQRLDKAKPKYPQPHESEDVANFREISGKFPGSAPAELELELEKELELELETEGTREESRLCVWPTFNDFWEKYDKKIDRPKCERKWSKLTQGAREKIMQHLEEYIRGTPDKQYRKNPSTYLNNASWENEVIINGKATTTQPADKNREHAAGLVAALQRDRAKLFEDGTV